MYGLIIEKACCICNLQFISIDSYINIHFSLEFWIIWNSWTLTNWRSSFTFMIHLILVASVHSHLSQNTICDIAHDAGQFDFSQSNNNTFFWHNFEVGCIYLCLHLNALYGFPIIFRFNQQLIIYSIQCKISRKWVCNNYF